MAKSKKPFLFALADKLFARIDEKTPADKVAEHAQTVRNAFRTETAGILAAALFAKKTLDSTRQVDMPFPEEYLSGERPLDEAAQAHLHAYAAALEAFQVKIGNQESPIFESTAKGLTTWIATFYAMALPDLLPQAKEMWAKLASGYDQVEEAHKFLLRRAPSDIERTYFDYRPKVLL